MPLPTISQTSLDRTIVTPSPDAMVYDGSVENTLGFIVGLRQRI